MRLIQVSSDDGIKGRIPVQPPACASTSSYHKKFFCWVDHFFSVLLGLSKLLKTCWAVSREDPPLAKEVAREAPSGWLESGSQHASKWKLPEPSATWSSWQWTGFPTREWLKNRPYTVSRPGQTGSKRRYRWWCGRWRSGLEPRLGRPSPLALLSSAALAGAPSLCRRDGGSECPPRAWSAGRGGRWGWRGGRRGRRHRCRPARGASTHIHWPAQRCRPDQQNVHIVQEEEYTHRVDGPVVDLCLLPGHGALSPGTATLKYMPEILQGELGRLEYNFLRKTKGWKWDQRR